METLKIKGDETLPEKIEKTVAYLKALDAEPPFSFSFFHEHTQFTIFAHETVTDACARLNITF